jgi:hypothetical protein
MDGFMSRVTVCFERREDGGLRAYSDDIPGLVLSHSDPQKLLADVMPALEVLETAAKKREADEEDRRRMCRESLAKRLREASPENSAALLREAAEWLEHNRYMSWAEERANRMYFTSWADFEAVDVVDRLSRAIEILEETNNPVVYFQPAGGIQVSDIISDAIREIRRLRGS